MTDPDQMFQWTKTEIAAESRWTPGSLPDQVHNGYVAFFLRRTGRLPPPVPKGYIEDTKTLNATLRAWEMTEWM